MSDREVIESVHWGERVVTVRCAKNWLGEWHTTTLAYAHVSSVTVVDDACPGLYLGGGPTVGECNYAPDEKRSTVWVGVGQRNIPFEVRDMTKPNELQPAATREFAAELARRMERAGA